MGLLFVYSSHHTNISNLFLVPIFHHESFLMILGSCIEGSVAQPSPRITLLDWAYY